MAPFRSQAASLVKEKFDRLKNKFNENNSPATVARQQTDQSPICEEALGDNRMKFVKALLYGLRAIPKVGAPGKVTEAGADSFCVAMTKSNDCFEAASVYGNGRIVAFGHNGYVKTVSDHPGSENEKRHNRLLTNAILWASNSECLLQDEAGRNCNAVCETQTSLLNYPFKWGVNCQQPIKVSVLGMDGKMLDKIVSMLNSVVGDKLVVKGAAYDAASQANIDQLLAGKPDVIVWTNGNLKYEVTEADSEYMDPRAESLLSYIQQGGAIVVGLCPWGWQSLTGVSVTERSLFNEVTTAIGITFTGDTIFSFDGDSVDVERSLEAAEQPATSAKVSAGLVKLQTSPNIDIEEAKCLLDTYLSFPAASFQQTKRTTRAWLPPANSDLEKMHAEVENVAMNIGRYCTQFPLTVGKGASTLPQSTAASMLYLAWLRRQAETRPPRELQAITPDVDTFPGSCGSGPRNSGMIVSILNVRPRFQTLGLYAPPGEVMTCTISDQSLADYPSLKLSIRIGSHTDNLAMIKDNYKLERHPRISLAKTWTPRELGQVDSTPMSKEATKSNSVEVSSIYGGIVYISVEDGVPKGEAPKPIVFNCDGGVPMPFYSHMKERRATDPSDKLYGLFNKNTDAYPFWTSTWEQRVSSFLDAPWTDIEGRYVTMTVPTAVVGRLSQQELWDLMDFWDAALYNELYLSGDIEDFEYSQERLACDKQISAGYMHSGYPVMCFTDIVTPKDGKLPVLLNLEELKRTPMWGVYHEFGHNRQKGEWTWQGMTEVTTNIFSLYNCNKMNGLSVYDSPWYRNAMQLQIDYLKAPNRRYDDYLRDAGLALGCFGVFAQSVGNWDILRNVFQQYRTAKDLKVGSNDEKINQWIRLTSLMTGQDLRPYYNQWKWPVNDSLLRDLDPLPKWNGNVLDILTQNFS